MELNFHPPLPPKPSRRLPFIDELRGFCIIYVILYHLFYDLHVLFKVVDLPFFWSSPMQISRIVVVMLLMILSGISCSFSRNNLKRGLKLLGVSSLITIVTYFILGENYILFGILHFFASAILIYCFIGKLLKKLAKPIFIPLFLILFVLTFNIYDGFIGLNDVTLALPTLFYNHWWLLPIGFGVNGFASVDYYPLLPWIFIFFVGVLLGDLLKSHELPNFLHKEYLPIVGLIGRHTLLLYIIHQPIFYLILWMITRFT